MTTARRKPLMTALALWFVAAPAHAGWGDFDALFAVLPCPDGWMACETSAGGLSPEPLRDGSGVPLPADLRVGWFDLAPTAAFSPFAAMAARSGSTAPQADQAAVAEQAAAKAEAEQVAAAEAQRVAQEQADEARRQREEAVARANQEAEAARRMSEQAASASAEERARLEKEASAARERAAAAERARIEAEAQERARQEAARAEAERMAKARAEAESARKAQEEAARKAQETSAVAAVDPTRPAPAVSSDCTDLTKLEPSSLLGTLTPGQIECVEKRVATDVKMTDKDKASRLLMSNAFAKGDKEGWEKLVKRHLEEINQSDPDLSYKYALVLSKMGPGRAAGVIKWSDVALENKTVWTGDTFTNRVNSLYKFRAVAAQSLWQKAETDFAAEANDDKKALVEKHRNSTKVYAREWFEYAKVAGKDATQALQLCMSAAGTKDYCEGP